MTDTLDLLHQLTRTHKTTIENDDGTRSYVEIYSYLEQLQQATTNNRGTGGSGSQTTSPISLKAVDLWQSIASTTLEHWPGRGRVHLARTPLDRRIQQWASHAVNSNDKTDEETLNAYLRHWITPIQQIFEPSIELAAPCPECNESFIWQHDGVENIKKRTLTYNQLRATCINCGQTWEGRASMANLARIINHGQPLNGSPAHTSQTE